MDRKLLLHADRAAEANVLVAVIGVGLNGVLPTVAAAGALSALDVWKSRHSMELVGPAVTNDSIAGRPYRRAVVDELELAQAFDGRKPIEADSA